MFIDTIDTIDTINTIDTIDIIRYNREMTYNYIQPFVNPIIAQTNIEDKEKI